MKKVVAVILALSLLAGAGCTPEAKSGTIEVWVTSSPPQYWFLITFDVTVSGIEIYPEAAEQGGWLPLSITGSNPFGLRRLEYEEIVLARLEVDAGNYTRLRLNIDKAVVTHTIPELLGEPADIGRETTEAEITASQLEFTRPFNVVGGETTVLLLDISASEESLSFLVGGRIIFDPAVTLKVQQAPAE